MGHLLLDSAAGPRERTAPLVPGLASVTGVAVAGNAIALPLRPGMAEAFPSPTLSTTRTQPTLW